MKIGSGHYTGYIDFVYYDVKADKYLVTNYSPVLIICSYARMVSYGEVFAGFYGMPPSYLFREISFHLSHTYTNKVDAAGDDISLSYENGADGKVEIT